MISVEDLHFSYPGTKKETIQGLDFNVREGEIFGFLGPSGAGKTTTQKIVIGILKAYRGSVRIGGRDIRSLDTSVYEQLGVSFEMPTLYTKLTARENLNFFASLYRSESENPMTLLTMVGLEEDADHRVGGFSKGMKMRLNLCRAMVHRPPILILDEPTTGQDPVNARRIKDLILELKHQGKTVFLNTHNMSVAEEICDRVAFIVDGEISLIESPRRLRIERGKRTVVVRYRAEGESREEEFELLGIGNNRKFLSLLKRYDVETMHTQEASLEDVFIEVTGRRLTGALLEDV